MKPILACYKLSDYTVQPWLDRLWSAATNQEFKDLLIQTPLIQKLIGLSSELVSIEKVHDVCQSVLQGEDFTTVVLFLWSLYQRENTLGPSIFTEYVEDTRKPLVKGYLPETPFDPLTTKNDVLQSVLLKHYEKDGEPFYQKSQLLISLYLLETVLQRTTLTEEEQMFAKLMQARVSYQRDQNLNSSIVHLKDASLSLYQSYIDLVRQAGFTECLGLLLAEFSYCQLHFYKYDQSEQSVAEAMQLLNLNIQLTGKLGKRTRYQDRDIAQLAIDIDTRSVKLNITETDSIYSTMTDVDNGIFKPEETTDWQVLEMDDIFFKDGPKFAEQQIDRDLSDTDLVLIAAHTNQLYNNRPDDEQREEMLRPYVLALTKHEDRNWLVVHNGMLWRSRNEFVRSKTKEKSQVFMQGLLDNYRDQKITSKVKLEYAFGVQWPMRYLFQKELAEMYQQTGMFMSAYELLSEVELSEDAIKCLAIAGRQTEAIRKADEYLTKLEAEGKTGLLIYSNALCLTADIKRDASLYSKAWEVSNQKCSRAMRSLARDFFFKNKFQEAIDCFNKAFAINMLYPKEQFTCGCAHMKLEQWDRAIFVFGTSISIDAKDTEAWGNIANCYHALGKYNEALQCTEQALKINRKSWRLWHNCIRFALQCNHLYKAIGAVNELIKMQHFDGLNGQLLVKISELFLAKYANDDNLAQNEFLRHKQRLYDFFKNFSNFINDHNVHRLVWRIKMTLGEPAQEVKDCKLKEIRALMIVNWQVTIKSCELIERAICELDDLYMQGLECEQEERAFVKTTALAIEECFKRKVKDLVARYQ